MVVSTTVGGGETKPCPMAGGRFGRLTVLEFSHSKNGKHWRCRCDCGGEITTSTSRLNSGKARSCGCLLEESRKKNLRPGSNKTHGMSRHPLDNVFDNMIKRCYRPGYRRYENYGGRGIGICDEWMSSRAAFYIWALDHGYQPGLTIDRIDVDGDYEPSNCRFVDSVTQMNNTTRNRNLTWKGKTQTVAQWAREIGVRGQALQHRVTRGWSVERIFTQPYRSRRSARA